MITYEKKMAIVGGTSWIVKLDNKTVGEIRMVEGGYQYFPKGGKAKDGGEIFPTLGGCKQSLES